MLFCLSCASFGRIERVVRLAAPPYIKNNKGCTLEHDCLSSEVEKSPQFCTTNLNSQPRSLSKVALSTHYTYRVKSHCLEFVLATEDRFLGLLCCSWEITMKHPCRENMTAFARTSRRGAIQNQAQSHIRALRCNLPRAAQETRNRSSSARMNSRQWNFTL